MRLKNNLWCAGCEFRTVCQRIHHNKISTCPRNIWARKNAIVEGETYFKSFGEKRFRSLINKEKQPDMFDSIGFDITEEEFLETEIFWETVE